MIKSTSQKSQWAVACVFKERMMNDNSMRCTFSSLSPSENILHLVLERELMYLQRSANNKGWQFPPSGNHDWQDNTKG